MLVDKEGVRIGRASDNEWVLPDPNRYISAHHARITFKNGTYIVEDTSTNGLYLNDELEPVGRLGPAALAGGRYAADGSLPHPRARQRKYRGGRQCDRTLRRSDGGRRPGTIRSATSMST